MEDKDNTGHNDSKNRGNVLELVEFLSKYDPVLKEYLLQIKMSDKITVSYLSPRIQNEFITVLGENVKKKIIDQVKWEKYFAIIFDSSPDLSHIDQTCQVLHFVIIEGSSVNVVELFIDFMETKGKMAEYFSNNILEKVNEKEIDIANCTGQAYDNVAVMSGKHNGVQKRIKDNSNVEFVLCSNHSLNLAGVHAAAITTNSVTYFGAVEGLFTFFSFSTHRWDVLIKVTGHGVKGVIKTRWSARGQVVGVVKKYFYETIDALEQLMGIEKNIETRSVAGLILSSIQSFSLLCFLTFRGTVIKEINDTQ